ncbi:(2Fe-2S) ferredoxin domain-containing protein [Sulfurimonas sp. HSL-1716]|uniref:(2Fe-2S) ferredoxin domain-containing protein n=1 Tax=Hydrocurvibacter sulfurireducens TaxID=3131937 RepID=UPI0031F956C7
MGIPQPAFYIFKCEQSSPPGMPKPSCVNPDTQDLFQFLAQTLMQKGIMGTVQPIRTSCLNRCNVGPVMLVEPGHTMYVGLDKAKIERIIDEHIIGGKIVEEYVISDELWDAPISPSDMQAQMGR